MNPADAIGLYQKRITRDDSNEPSLVFAFISWLSGYPTAFALPILSIVFTKFGQQ